MLNSLQELINEPEITQIDDPEEIFTTSEVSWNQYEALLAKLENNTHYHINYLDGILEIVSPSFRHEKLKKRLATLIEFYLIKKRIKHTPMGSPRIKKQLKNVGAEPDECYCIREEKDIPDLAVEVIITSGSIDKLDTYRRLGVTEVWLWKANRIKVYHLREATLSIFEDNYGYEQIVTSELLPGLDIALLEQCVFISDQIEAVDAFEKGLKP